MDGVSYNCWHLKTEEIQQFKTEVFVELSPLENLPFPSKSNYPCVLNMGLSPYQKCYPILKVERVVEVFIIDSERNRQR